MNGVLSLSLSLALTYPCDDLSLLQYLCWLTVLPLDFLRLVLASSGPLYAFVDLDGLFVSEMRCSRTLAPLNTLKTLWENW